jgi:carbonic anhydrase
MLKNIKPSVGALSGYKGEKNSKNPEFVHLVAEKNVELTMQNVRDGSSVIKGMEDAGEIKIIGALYDMHTGAVNFMN